MCIITFAWHVVPEYPLVLISNRDEFYMRKTIEASRWQTDNEKVVISGRDGVRGGTWLGMTEDGRLAGVTNYRDGDEKTPAPLSRGNLTLDFLQGHQSAEEYLSSLLKDDRPSLYHGFNLLIGNVFEELYWTSNKAADSENCASFAQITPGIHSICNHLLDTPWPKVQKSKQALESVLLGQPLEDESVLIEQLFAILKDEARVDDDAKLPNTRVPLAVERALSSIFVTIGPVYGTRSSTVILVDQTGKLQFLERSSSPLRKMNMGDHKFSFSRDRTTG